MDKALSFAVHAEVYHVVVASGPRPPHGKAPGHFKRPRGEWRAIQLDEDDVVARVNVRFLAAHHGICPDEIIALRHKDDDFVNLRGRVKAARAQGPAGKPAAAPAGASTVVRSKETAPAKGPSAGPGHGGPSGTEGGPKGGSGKGK